MKEFAWSFSALTRFENCAKQYYHLSVAKDFKDEDTEFSAEGKDIHLAMYGRVIKNRPLPLNLRWLEPTAAKFVGLPGETSGELKFAISRQMAPLPYFDPGVFVRVVVDLLNVRPRGDGLVGGAGERGTIVDWKTGKPKPGFAQLELSAAVLSRHVPEIEEFRLVYVWLQHPKTPPSYKVVTKQDLIGVWNDFLPRVAKIEQALKTTDFPARPSGLCRYCPVTSCPNWKPR